MRKSELGIAGIMRRVRVRREAFASYAACAATAIACSLLAASAASQLSGSLFLIPPIIPISNAPIAVVGGDFDEDGSGDLAVLSYGAGGVHVLRGHGDGTFTDIGIFGGNTIDGRCLAVGDFNGDRHLDLVLAEGSSSRILVLLGQGDGTFVTGNTKAVGQGPAAIAVADFDADGSWTWRPPARSPAR